MAPGESASASTRLVEAHLDLAHRVAGMILGRIGGHCERDELVSLAMAGLAEAAARFDPAQGVAFRSYAYYRVHGAVIDGLRRQGNLPRRVWRALTSLRAASEYLENQGERARGARAQGAPAPSTAQTLRDMKDALSAIQTMYIIPMGDVGDKMESPDPAEPADEAIDRGRLSRRIARAVAALPERERALVQKHYFEGKNLLEAGQDLGISKSWASRLHAQAVDRIRTALAEGDAVAPPDDG